MKVWREKEKGKVGMRNKKEEGERDSSRRRDSRSGATILLLFACREQEEGRETERGQEGEFKESHTYPEAVNRKNSSKQG